MIDLLLLTGQVSPTTTLYPGSGDDLDTIPTSTTLVQQTVMPASSEHHQTISPVTTSLYDQGINNAYKSHEFN